MGFSEGCGGFEFEFGVLHWAEMAKPQREREREAKVGFSAEKEQGVSF